MRVFEGAAKLRPVPRRLRRTMLPTMAVAGLAVAVAACTSGGSNGASSGPSAPSHAVEQAAATGHVKGSLTVWVDAVRLPVAQAYAKAHPNVHVHIVTFDGDANGATSLQAKIQLWNRTGNGWPDVIFSEQVNDPVWMAKPPFNFAAPIKASSRRAPSVSGLHPRPRSARSTARSTVSRTTWPRWCSGTTRS